MKNFLIAFSVFIVWSFFGLWLYSWFQSDENPTVSKTVLAENNGTTTTENTSDKSKDAVIDPELNLTPIEDTLVTSTTSIDVKELKNVGLKAVNAEGDTIFKYDEGVSIIENSGEIFISETITDFKYKVKNYLLEHPNTEVHISSLYSASENFESPNLGVKRGEKIKDALISIEVPKEKIVVKSIIKSIEFDEEGFYNNSISINFKPLDLLRLEELKTKIPETKTLYPRFSNSGILINRNLRTLYAEIKEIVASNPDIRVELIGHTDNIGNGVDNYKLGLNYARQVEWYLVAKGAIKNSKIKASSKGEEDPIDSNKTNNGRIANRRIEVVFY